MKLAVLLSILPAALAFMDAGAFFSSKSDGSGLRKLTLVESEYVDSITNDLSSLACSSDEKLVIHRVSDLSVRSLHKQLNSKVKSGLFAKYVHYDSPEALELPLSTQCKGNQIRYVDADNDASTSIGDESVLVINYADATDLDFEPKDGSNFIIQVLPSFSKPESTLEGLKHYVEDQVKENFHVELDFDDFNKRDEDLEKYEDDEFNHLVEEVEEDFRAAESYIMKEGNDLPVNIMETEDKPKASSTATPSTYPNNLFTNYEFFTPGIFSCLLVSGILVGILYTALTWLTSLEISYKSFDKQIDFEKKTE
ncbi:hypothetical protein CLIB1423_09S00716 [[Candida] railenensis]|uniref:Protein BIG1 n=1 Tax=[Candida] railenensis TaxID=45579 RepID=A0A9P0QR12_9ASCO|nr:hypothetical protein CLIB1423_09S00716 [[Candida] railenensis]